MQTRRKSLFFLLAASVLVLHLTLLILLRERSLPFSYLIAGFAYLPAIILCLRQPCTGRLRIRWLLFAASLTFEMLELLSASIHSSVWFYLPSLFQVVSFTLCLLVVATPALPGQSRWIRAIDILLAGSVCALSTVAFLLPHNALSPAQWLASLTLIRLVPAVAALLSMQVAANPEKRRLIRLIAIYQSADFISTLILNQVLGTWLNLPRATFLDFCLELPVLILTLCLAMAPALPTRSAGRSRFIVRSGLPLFISLSVLTLGFWLFPRTPLAGAIGIAIAILGYAVRSTLSQGSILETEAQLRRSVAQLRDLADRDPLTNAGNRRAFDRIIRQEFPHATPTSPLALILMDVDLFKQINDSMGHLYGDRCLRAVASVLDLAARDHIAKQTLAPESSFTDEEQTLIHPPQAHVCRFGGDEFAIILPHTSIHHAAQIADRVCSETRALALRVPGDAPLTVSVGVAAAHPVDGRTSASLIAEADENLHQAKRAGRNQAQRTPVRNTLAEAQRSDQLDDQLHTLVLRVAALALRAPLPPGR